MLKSPFSTRSLLFVVIGVALLSIFSFGFYRLYPQLHGMAVVRSTNAETVDVQIQNLRLRIPKNHIDFPPETTKPDVAISLIALLPDFEGRTIDNMREFQDTLGHGRIVRILIQDISGQRPFEQRNAVKKAELGEFIHKDDVFGLARFTYQAPEPGLRSIEIYEERQGGELQSYFECSIDGAVASPGCVHIFLHKNLLFTVTYGKGFLANWQKTRQDLLALFDSLITQ